MSDSNTTRATTEERPGAPRQWVKDLNEGDLIRGVYAIRDAPVEKGATGMSVKAGDATGDLTLITWKMREVLHGAAVPGTAVHVEGKFSIKPTYGEQIEITSIGEAKATEYDPIDLYPKSPETLSTLDGWFDELFESLEKSKHLAEVIERLLRTGKTAELWRDMPVTLDGPFAYRHGEFERTMLSGRSASALAEIHGWRRDLAVACALLRNIGGVEVFVPLHIGFGMTDAGDLLGGDSPPGFYLVRKAIEAIEGFPEEDSLAIYHTVLAAKPGTGVTPRIRETGGVAATDGITEIDGKFLKLEREAPPGSAWSRPSKDFGGAVFLPGRST